MADNQAWNGSAWWSISAAMDLAIGEHELGAVVEETPSRSFAGRVLLKHFCWAFGSGALQFLAVRLMVSGIGWEGLPYDTIGQVGVWIFLAINGSACVILTYSLLRFRKPILWFWWAACATWWLTILIPYEQGKAVFAGQLSASESAGLQLAQRIDAYHKEKGHLPRKLDDVARRDGQPVPDLPFGKPIRYQIAGLEQYALVIEAGDKTYCYSSREAQRGFVQRYFDGTGS